MKQSDGGLWLPARETAAAFQVSDRTIRRWAGRAIAAGEWQEGKHWKLPGGHKRKRLYNVRAIDKWRTG